MSVTSASNAATSGANATASSQFTSSHVRETEDRFLRLLVTQMKNQDPLNPLDNAQVTSQMAQLSTVTGVNKLNDTVKALSDSFLAGQSLQAAALVGHGVMVPGNKLNLSGGAAYAGVEVSGAVDKLVVNVKNASGVVVHSADLGAQKAADTVPFQWDGRNAAGALLPDGAYTFEVSATQGGKKVETTALAVGQVGSVSLGAQGAILNVTGFGAIPMSQVRQIL